MPAYIKVAIVLASFVAGMFVMHAQSRLSEGAKPYTPTRLEWLVQEMNSTERVELSETSAYSMDFVGVENTDTILIVVRYLSDISDLERQLMNSAIETAKQVIRKNSQGRGWDSWLKVSEDVQANKANRGKEGLRAYAPTRIEWLALELEASLRIDYSESSHHSLGIVVLSDDTLGIYVQYDSLVNRAIMNGHIDTARKVISMNAKSKGWDSWLKIREELKPLAKYDR